eukprot:scaffold103586_cov63-Phaeocystis_antarctica.AAC.1
MINPLLLQQTQQRYFRNIKNQKVPLPPLPPGAVKTARATLPEPPASQITYNAYAPYTRVCTHGVCAGAIDGVDGDRVRAANVR